MDTLLDLLQNNQADSLKIEYLTLQSEPNGIQTLTDAVSSYLRQTAIATLANAEISNAVICIQKKLSADQRLKIAGLDDGQKNLLDLKDRMASLATNAFENNSVIKKKMVDDYEYIINHNGMMSRYLSLYIDDVVKRKLRKEINNDELTLSVDKALNIHRYLMDKVFFEFYYKHDLTKRLLDHETVNVELEKKIVLKLQMNCHRNFIIQVESMLRATQHFGELNEEFQDYISASKQNDLDFEFNVRVLTTRVWPIYSFGNCHLPENCFNAVEMFIRFYGEKYRGGHRRQLTFHAQLGTVEMDAFFYDSNKRYFKRGDDGSCSIVSAKDSVRKQTISVSTYQMCILMLFNDMKSITYEELKRETGIIEKDLLLALEFLAFGDSKQRVLNKTPDTEEIKAHHVFSVNDSFASELSRISIKSNERFHPKGPAVCGLINQDRVCEINQSIIVVMKRERLLMHKVLKTEVCDLLRPRFSANPNMVDKQIKHFIDCGYLFRSALNRELYKYNGTAEELDY